MYLYTITDKNKFNLKEELIMGLVLLLIAAVLFVPPFYQKKYFEEYETITKGKAFALGIGYYTIFVFMAFFPIVIATEYGTVATVITAVLALASTGGVIYLIFKKRLAKFEEEYPGDKLLPAKEMVACIGAFTYPIILIFGFILIIALKISGTSRRRA